MKLSGLCFAGMLIHFYSGKFQVLDLSTFLAKVMLKFSVNFGMACATNWDISSARDLPHREGVNVPAKHRPFYVIIHFSRSRIN